MRIVRGPIRSRRVRAEARASIRKVVDFDFSGARIAPDARRGYGETRFIAVDYLGSRLHVVAFTLRGEVLRVISLRRANAREAAGYANA